MKQFIIIVIIHLIFLQGFSQKRPIDSLALSENEIAEIFTLETKSDLGIIYPIRKVYNYKDKSGEYYLVLAERLYRKEKDRSFSDTIIAINYKKSSTGYKKVWYMRDFILKRNDSNEEEHSMWFWTKYVELKDFNKDGIIEPILVYGTSGDNGLEFGRLKILCYYKGKKYAVRHQNSAYDMIRYTTVDAALYTTPKKIQTAIIDMMDKIEENGHAIFAHSHRKQMSKQKTRFDDLDYSE